jgi:hypothetical protein
MSPHLKKVMELLLTGKADDARRLFHGEVQQELERLRADLHAAEQERDVLEMLISAAERHQPHTLNGAVSNSNVAPTWNVVSVTPPKKLVKSKQVPIIMQVASELAAKSGGRVSTEAIIDGLRSQGFILDSRVPGTSIGNILYRAPGWTRIDRGVFAPTSSP